MRRRVSFIHRPEHGIDPNSLELTDDGVSGPKLLAAREERLTLALDELPAEFAAALKDITEELHLRWASTSAYGTLEPFSSRVSPGLHLIHAPRRGSNAGIL